LNRKGGNLFALTLPLGPRVDQQAAIWVARDREASMRLLDERIPMPGRHINAALGI
jgi:hypothetical protein